MNEQTKPLFEYLAIVLKSINQLEGAYYGECDGADWFNNNTPNVGISVDYMPRPPIPKALTEFRQLRDKLINDIAILTPVSIVIDSEMLENMGDERRSFLEALKKNGLIADYKIEGKNISFVPNAAAEHVIIDLKFNAHD